MAAIAPMGGSVRDALLTLSGTEADPTQTITVDTYGPVVYIGESRRFNARLTISGTVSGTNPTLDVSLESSADGVTGFTTLASFPQRTTSNAAATGAHTAPDKLVAITPVGQPYVRVLFNIGGSNSPTFPGTSVLVGPDAGFGI